MANNGQEQRSLAAVERALSTGALPDGGATTVDALRSYASKVRSMGRHARETGLYLEEMANRYADNLEKTGISFNTEFLSVERQALHDAEQFIGRKDAGGAPIAKN